jgi:predicted DNA-binding transcriptional regulator YafY
MPDEVRPRRSDSDRRLRQAARFARVLRVLELIQGRGRSDIKDLAHELECSERTIFRDLNVLELAGVPWFYDETEGCYRLRPDFRFPVINLTDDEILGQATAVAITSATGLDINSGAGPTAKKLSAASRDKSVGLLADLQRLTSVLELKMADHSRHHEVIRSIQWALIQGKQLTGMYTSPYQSKSKRLTLRQEARERRIILKCETFH